MRLFSCLSNDDSRDAMAPARTSFLTIFAVFLRLGLSSFGGPSAHLGYFRDEFVVRRGWLGEDAYADLVALCQFLPGPASSQVGFSLGVMQGRGLLGGCAAWLGFTLPSAVIMFAFALGAASFSGPLAQGLIHGFKLVAVAVVAHAVLGMARSLAPDGRRAGIALGALCIVNFMGGMFGQVAAIGAGALAGWLLCRSAAPSLTAHVAFPVSRTAGIAALVLFAGLLLGTSLLAGGAAPGNASLFDAFYRSGALVFGGGHVVLPLLRAELVAPGWIGADRFLAGYGVAQAVPGPLFTFAAYLGAASGIAAGPASGAAVALVAVFLPGLLLVYGALPFWSRLRAWPGVQSAMRGANAAVVGVLGAALYDPVWTGAVLEARDFAAVVAGFLMLTVWKVAPGVVVVVLAAVGMMFKLM